MKVLRRLLPFAVIAAAAALLLYLPDIAPDRYTDLATFFRVERLRQGYSGFSVAAVSDGAVLYVDGFGRDGDGNQVKSDTPLYASSVSKAYAAFVAASLAHEGRLNLDKPVHDYLPWFDPDGSIKVRDLMAHTSGYSDRSFKDLHPRAASLVAAVHDMSDTSPSFPAGSRFIYLETDYQALALVEEVCSGSSYSELLNRRLFQPLGMKTSSAMPVAGLLTPVGSASFFSLPIRRVPPVLAYVDPASHAISSAADVGRFMAYLLAPAKSRRSLLTSREVQAFFQPSAAGIPYGYGLFLEDDQTLGRVAYHDGAVDGFSSRVVMWPGDRKGIAILTSQSSLLQSLVALPAMTEGARSIMASGAAARPFPLGRLYILLAVCALVHLLVLISQTGSSLQWAKTVRDKAEAKGSSGPIWFALFRSFFGIACRLALAFLFPYLIGIAFGRRVFWVTLFQLEPAVAVWCLAACLVGCLRNAARLSWMRFPFGFRATH